MSENQIHLLSTKRFLPLFVTQALSALDDDLFKNALALLIIYRIAEEELIGGIVLVEAGTFLDILAGTIAGGLLILRDSRFAKNAGEMVSLTAVEALAAAAWPDHMHAAISVPDARKGEQIILLTDSPDADRDALSKHALSEGISELAVSRTVRTVDAVPLLGTGKIDYVSVSALTEIVSTTAA